MKLHAPSLLAAVLVTLVLMPIFEVGFLADDFYMGEKIAERAVESPGVISAIHDAFAHRWTPMFDVFRPLTIISLQVDYVVFGANGAAHHITNVVLWLLCALVFSGIAARLTKADGAWTRAAWVLLFGAWPAGIEAVGWLVAREDLFCAFFGLLAFRMLLARPDRPGLVAMILVGAFLSKETSVVLPLVLLWTDFVLDPARLGGGTVQRALATIRRHGPSLGLLVGYFALRYALFGKIGGDYNGRPYSEFLFEEGAAGRIAGAIGDCFVRLAAPVNDYAWLRLFGFASTAVLFALPLLAGVVIVLGLRQRRDGDLRVPLAGLAWFFGPLLLLVVPLDGVGPGMEKSRFLVIPMVGWLLTIAVALARLRDAGSRRLAIGLGIAIVAAGGASWRLNLTSYTKATARVDLILGQVTDQMETGSGGLILRTAPRGRPRGVHHELSLIEGCHVLSAALFHATRPPYITPGITLRPVPDDLVNQLPEIIGFEGTRPYVAEFVPSNLGGPAIHILARAGLYGDDPHLEPRHGTRIAPGWTPEFSIRGLRGPATSADHVRIVVLEPLGNSAIADLPWRLEEPTADDPDHYTLRVRGGEFEVFRRKVNTRLPLTWEVIERLPHGYFLWWAEVYEGDRLLVRSQYQVVHLPAR